MIPKNVRGFTLIEVVLAIAVGLIIIAGISVGYANSKRWAIVDNQQKNVTAIKTWVEQAVTAQEANAINGGGARVPPAITREQLVALAGHLPSLVYDPYTGANRTQTICATSGPNPILIEPSSCIGIHPATGATSYNIRGNRNPGAGAAVVYIYGSSYTDQFTAAGRTYYGYIICETDTNGQLIAADGGEGS